MRRTAVGPGPEGVVFSPLMAADLPPLIFSTATEADLRAEFQRIQAATIRGDPDEAKAIRERAHALLDACLDQHAEWATMLRMQLLAALGG